MGRIVICVAAFSPVVSLLLFLLFVVPVVVFVVAAAEVVDV